MVGKPLLRPPQGLFFRFFIFESCRALQQRGWESVGKTTWRKLFQQKQVSTLVQDPFGDDYSSPFTLLQKSGDFYQENELMFTPGRYQVCLSKQIYPERRPVTFDNDANAFYIVRAMIESSGNPHGFGIPEQQWGGFAPRSTSPSASSTVLGWRSPPLASSDALASAVPWRGVIPGNSTMPVGLYSVAASEQISRLLSVSMDILHGDLELGLWNGGVHVPAQTDPSMVEGYRADTFYHPYTCMMRGELNKGGVDGLLVSNRAGLRRQLASSEHDHLKFNSAAVVKPFPVADFAFEAGAAYGVYNWELFFHVPLYIAERLRREHRFAEAMRWYQYIFDPLARTASDGDSGTERYWNVKPLYREAKGKSPDVVKYVFGQSFSGWDDGDPLVREFLASVEAWIEDPFSPHAVARWRAGTTYRWVVLQRYLDNLIDWADSLFRRDTIESVNEATQLYLLAAQILGPRPKNLPAIEHVAMSFEQLAEPEEFGGMAELEGFVPAWPLGGNLEDDLVWRVPTPPQPLWWYFCLPPNERLLAYWDTVADRLFKIRNCQNIEGVRRALALFDPPIDPALLVKAKAAGLDLGAVIADLQSPLPHHRYRVLAARALELVGDVRALGSALQQALERKDAEHLQELRAAHEVMVLEAVRRVREGQVKEAEESRKVLDGQLELALDRERYYGTRERQSGRESKQLQKAQMATGFMIAAQVHKLIGGILMAAIPTIQGGTGFFLHYGGANIGGSLGLMGESFDLLAAGFREQAARMQIEAGYDRRWDDWKFQEGQAKLEQKHIEQQVVAADIRVDIAKKELENHDRQIEQAKGVEEFLRTRFTNEQLYNWMVGQISRLYFQTYKLAYDMAKKAERAMRYELGDDDTYVEFGHWCNGSRTSVVFVARYLRDFREAVRADWSRSCRGRLRSSSSQASSAVVSSTKS